MVYDGRGIDSSMSHMSMAGAPLTAMLSMARRLVSGRRSPGSLSGLRGDSVSHTSSKYPHCVRYDASIIWPA